MALIGPHLVARVTADEDQLHYVLLVAIGIALLFAASTYALRPYIGLLHNTRGTGAAADPDPRIRPVPTLLVGALGGLLVGIASVGSGYVIMVALLVLYPGLSAVRLVGTDLVQAGPLVLAAAVSQRHRLSILVPLVLGSVPGTLIGSAIASRVPQYYTRRGIVVVLATSGVALIDKSGWAPLGPTRC